MSERQRIRVKACCIADCTNDVRRGQDFGVCTDHLLRIWRQIDRERQRLGSSALYGVPENRDLDAGPGALQVAEIAHKIKSRPAHTQEGTIYVLDTGVNDGVKIGWTSRDVWQRLAEYPPTFRVIITAPGTRADERDLHRSLKLFRMAGMGKEWYHAENGEVIRTINDLIARSNIHLQQIEGREAERDLEQTLWAKPPRRPMKHRIESLAEWRAMQPAPVVNLPGPKGKSWGRMTAG